MMLATGWGMPSMAAAAAGWGVPMQMPPFPTSIPPGVPAEMMQVTNPRLQQVHMSSQALVQSADGASSAGEASGTPRERQARNSKRPSSGLSVEESNKRTREDRAIWTDPASLALVVLVHDHNSNGRRATANTIDWQTIAQNLNAAGHNFNVSQCQTRYTNIKSTMQGIYNLESNKKGTTGAPRWQDLNTDRLRKEYGLKFAMSQQLKDLLDPYFNTRPSVAPPMLIDFGNFDSVPAHQPYNPVAHQNGGNAIAGGTVTEPVVPPSSTNNPATAVTSLEAGIASLQPSQTVAVATAANTPQSNDGNIGINANTALGINNAAAPVISITAQVPPSTTGLAPPANPAPAPTGAVPRSTAGAPDAAPGSLVSPAAAVAPTGNIANPPAALQDVRGAVPTSTTVATTTTAVGTGTMRNMGVMSTRGDINSLHKELRGQKNNNKGNAENDKINPLLKAIKNSSDATTKTMESLIASSDRNAVADREATTSASTNMMTGFGEAMKSMANGFQSTNVVIVKGYAVLACCPCAFF